MIGSRAAGTRERKKKKKKKKKRQRQRDRETERGREGERERGREGRRRKKWEERVRVIDNDDAIWWDIRLNFHLPLQRPRFVFAPTTPTLAAEQLISHFVEKHS